MNRELDAWIAEYVMGWSWDLKSAKSPTGSTCDNKEKPFWWLPEYSSYIGDAWSVVEKLRTPQVAFNICTLTHQTKNPTMEWIARFEFFVNKRYEFVLDTHESAPMAICLAAKKLVKARG